MNNSVKTYLQPAFLICAVVLAVAGGGMSIAIKSFGVVLKKEPLPLKKSLDFLDEKNLGPYKVISKEKIKNLEVVKSLGTEDYIKWNLEDTDVAADSAVRYCSLFITYYDYPELVVHVPEECFTGGGNQRLASDSVTFVIDNNDLKQEIPAKYLVFESAKTNDWRSGTKFSALYFFSVNNVYSNSREMTRMILGKNLFGKHSYFSKVEWRFFNMRFGAPVNPKKEQTMAASRKLLGVILPVLEKEHWPDWDIQSESDIERF